MPWFILCRLCEASVISVLQMPNFVAAREEDFNTKATENTEKTKDRESILAFFSVASVSSVNSVLKSSSVAATGPRYTTNRTINRQNACGLHGFSWLGLVAARHAVKPP